MPLLPEGRKLSDVLKGPRFWTKQAMFKKSVTVSVDGGQQGSLVFCGRDEAERCCLAGAIRVCVCRRGSTASSRHSLSSRVFRAIVKLFGNSLYPGYWLSSIESFNDSPRTKWRHIKKVIAEVEKGDRRDKAKKAV